MQPKSAVSQATLANRPEEKDFSWFVCPLLTVYKGERAEMSSFPSRKSPPFFDKN
jgi:hypothetical protein